MSEKTEKKSFFERIGKFFRDQKAEVKKIVWPSKKQVINNTLIVIACVAVVGLFIWIFDFIAGGAIRGLISLLG